MNRSPATSHERRAATPGPRISGDPRTRSDPDATGAAHAARACERAAFDVVAIVGSRGALPALRELLSGLRDRFPAAVVVLLHWPPNQPLELASLERLSVLPITLASDGQPLKPATVFLAPPDRHLLIKPDGSPLLTQTPRLHFVRPSAELLFESLAASCGNRAIAVILSGLGSDGSIGVRSVKAAGGTVIAQNQASAEYFAMPKAAIDTGCVDYVLPLEQLAPTLGSLVNQHHNRQSTGACGGQ